MQAFLVSLAMAILKSVIEKGSVAAAHLIALEIELAKAQKKANTFEKIKNDPNATREDRRNAENDALS
jgi:predicted nucleotide-binding protein (sugar kinase/HSP70/actin superfamily)